MDTPDTRRGATDLVGRYLNRRLPWGTPWWPYAVALGAANLARQLLLPDLSDGAEIAVFVAMVAVVVAAVTIGHRLLWPPPRPVVTPVPRVEPPGARSPNPAPAGEPEPELVVPPDRWAPWWWYVVTIVGLNYLRQAVMPVGTVPEWAVVMIVVAMSAILFVAVTWAYRTTRA